MWEGAWGVGGGGLNVSKLVAVTVVRPTNGRKTQNVWLWLRGEVREELKVNM